MKIAVLVLVLTTLSLGYSSRLEDYYSEDEIAKIPDVIKESCLLNFTQLVTKHQYPVELHKVHTKDGYILTVHRIPHGRGCKSGKEKIPVLIVHGLFSSSIEFVLSGPGEGLGYILADECYDVWLINSRGNTYSREHETLTVKDKKFWEFSWHEFGVYDVPAVIDHILEVTGKPDLHYIGHSQGTTQFFVFGSFYPEYHQKLRSVHCLAPVAYMQNLRHPFVKLAALISDPAFNIAEIMGMYELLPTFKLIHLLGYNICLSKNPQFEAVCRNLVFLATGSTVKMMNTTLLPAILCHTPAGCSTRQITHYLQLVGKDYFRQFDHGRRENVIRYGADHPPRYDIRKVNVSTFFYYSDGDWFTDVSDVHRLREELPNVRTFRTPKKDFGHVDFVYGLDVRSLVYDRLLSVLKRY